MTVPDWRTSTAGARVRVALWLRAEVGHGGTFTKAQLRDAFPNVEQIDRRMRDLRAEGWVITTYREDRSLSVDELRLVTEGGAVWERGYQSRSGSTAVTDKQRQAVFAADHYACVYCGVAAGESHADDPLRKAKLSVARLLSSEQDQNLVTVCDRCHAAVRDSPLEASLASELAALDDAQRERLRQWVRRGARPVQPEEMLWNRYRRSPAVLRRELEHHLRRNG
jgi:cytochrome c553